MSCACPCPCGSPISVRLAVLPPLQHRGTPSERKPAAPPILLRFCVKPPTTGTPPNFSALSVICQSKFASQDIGLFSTFVRSSSALTKRRRLGSAHATSTSEEDRDA